MTTPELQKLATTANRAAVRFNGSRATCILTSFALHDVLQRLGYSSRPLRIEAAVFPDDLRLCGTILGGWREPGCRRAASSGTWRGHLAVIVDDEWLLDPTLDQANKKEWPRSMRVGPLAIRLSENFWAERGSILVRTNGCEVRLLRTRGKLVSPMPATPGRHTGSRSPIESFERLKLRGTGAMARPHRGCTWRRALTRQRTMTTKSNQRSPAMRRNEDRASAALAAVEAYRNVRDKSPRPTGDMWETISDLAGDLCHLAARHEIPPFDMMKAGARYYAAEAVDDTGDFLEVRVTLEVVARPNGSEEEDFQEFNDPSAAFWRAQASEWPTAD